MSDLGHRRFPVFELERRVREGASSALILLPEPSNGPVLVVKDDVITGADRPVLRESLDTTIGVTPYEVDMLFCVVRMGGNGLLANIEEKPRITEFVAAGLY